MDLKTYLFLNNIPSKQFSKKIQVSRCYFSSLINGKVPGKKLAMLIEILTEGFVKFEDFLRINKQMQGVEVSNDGFFRCQDLLRMNKPSQDVVYDHEKIIG